MGGFTSEDMKSALQALSSMIGRGKKAQQKFAPGTSHYTLQENRIRALEIAASLIRAELDGKNVMAVFSQDELKDALAPIASLTSKSEKAREKLKPSSWQHTMLGNNLKALYIASPLLDRALIKTE